MVRRGGADNGSHVVEHLDGSMIPTNTLCPLWTRRDHDHLG
jgi:hypothetical protein